MAGEQRWEDLVEVAPWVAVQDSEVQRGRGGGGGTRHGTSRNLYLEVASAQQHKAAVTSYYVFQGEVIRSHWPPKAKTWPNLRAKAASCLEFSVVYVSRY